MVVGVAGDMRLTEFASCAVHTDNRPNQVQPMAEATPVDYPCRPRWLGRSLALPVRPRPLCETTPTRPRRRHQLSADNLSYAARAPGIFFPLSW